MKPARGSWFNVTVDNSLHMVTSQWFTLERNAEIQIELELVVLGQGFKFDIILCLEKGASGATLRSADPLSLGIGEDGSFARVPVEFDKYEKQCFGRKYDADVPCFNQWVVSEREAKKKFEPADNPREIGKMVLHLLFVPRPANAGDDDMPKSMNDCIRELTAAGKRTQRTMQGSLAQIKGDVLVSETPLHPIRRIANQLWLPGVEWSASLQARRSEVEGLPRIDRAP